MKFLLFVTNFGQFPVRDDTLIESIDLVIFLVFSIGLVVVKKLRENQTTEEGGGAVEGSGDGAGEGGEVSGGGGGGGVVLKNQSVIYTREVVSDDVGDNNDDKLCQEASNYDAGGRKLAENYPSLSYREADPILEQYPSDHWERTHIKLNPLYHSYS